MLFILLAAVFLLGAVSTIGSQTAAGVFMFCLVAVFAGFAWSLHRKNQRLKHGLTIVVSADRLELSRDGKPLDTVQKVDIGLIVLHAISGYGAPGLVDFQIYRPDRSLLGRWDTDWDMAGPNRSIRALRRYDYPWFLHDTGAAVWKDKFRSKSAPTWASQVLGV